MQTLPVPSRANLLRGITHIYSYKADLSTESINILGILEFGSIFWMNLISLHRIFETQMSPKTWMRTVYLKLDILARLGVV